MTQETVVLTDFSGLARKIIEQIQFIKDWLMALGPMIETKTPFLRQFNNAL